MGIGPVPAVAKVFPTRLGLSSDEHRFRLVELNEAFAAQVLAVPQRLEVG